MEREAGLTDEKLIEAHGSFSSAHCIECEEKYEKDWLKGKVYTIVTFPIIRPPSFGLKKKISLYMGIAQKDHLAIKTTCHW